MSSSTMIHGATILRPRPQRTIADAATRLASQNHAGSERAMATDSARTREALAAKPDLVEEPRDLRRLVALRPDADVRSRRRHLAEDLVPHGLPACRLLQRTRVRVRDAVEIVLAPHVL